MARERYFIDNNEDTIHANEIVLTDKKDIRKNWWHYHKTIVFAVIIAAGVLFSMIYSLVTKVEPDYSIGILTATALPDPLVKELKDYLTQYADDRNGDGKVVVAVNSYEMGNAGDASADPNIVQAAVVRFTGDVTANESMIFIYDTKTLEYLRNSSFQGLLRYNDGKPMPETANDYNNAMINWDAVAALANFKPESLIEDNVSTEDALAFLRKYNVSFRAETDSISDNKKAAAYYEAADSFFQRLIKNEKVNNAVQETSSAAENK